MLLGMVQADFLLVLQQCAFIGAVLAGFAVALFMGLLPLAPGRRIAAWAAGTALTAAVSLIVATFSAVSGIVAWSFDPGPIDGARLPETVQGAWLWIILPFQAGLFLFLVSLGFSGWVRSRALGLVSSWIAGMAIVSLVLFLVFVVRAF